MRFIGAFFLLITITYSPSGAQDKFDSLQHALQNSSTPNVQVDIYNQLGYEYWIVNPHLSIQYGDTALAISKKENYSTGIAFANRVIGVGNWALGWYEPALSHLFDARSKYESIGDSLGMANCILNIGMVYEDQNNHVEALSLYSEAANHFQKLDSSRLATAYNKLANIYIMQEEFDKAEKYLTDAFVIHRDNNFDYGQAESLNRLGLVNKARGEYVDGVNHIKISAKISERIGDIDGLTKSYENIASIYMLQKDFQYAESYALLSEQLALQNGSARWLPDIYKDLMEINRTKGNKEKALDYYDKYTQYKDSLFNQKVAQDIANLHARIAEEQHQNQLQQRKQEILLLEEEARQNQIILIASVTILLLISAIVFLVFRFQKLRIAKEKEIAVAEQDKLQQELETKNQKLTSYTVNFIRKNELLEELQEEIDRIKRVNHSGDKKDLNKLGKIINSHQQIDKDWEDFKLHFENVHKDFFVKLNYLNPSLTNNDLKLCALVRLNLSMKEIAQMLGISTESVKTARYRLRKKLNLEHEDSLNDYLIGLDKQDTPTES